MEQQLRRYFIGIISFGFIVTWIAVGTLAAFGGLLCALATTTVPALLETRRMHRRVEQRRPRSRERPLAVTARPLADDEAEELPLVPDEPSLIIGVSS